MEQYDDANKALRDAINYLQGEALRLQLTGVAHILGNAILELDQVCATTPIPRFPPGVSPRG